MSFHSRESSSAIRDESVSDSGRLPEPEFQPITKPPRLNSFFSYFEPSSARRRSGMNEPGPSRGPISPPPLKRPSSGAAPRAESPAVSASTPSVYGVLPGSETTKATTPALSSNSDIDAALRAPSITEASRQTTPPPSKSLAFAKTSTPKSQMRLGSEWTFDKIVERLNTFHHDVKTGHAQLAAYVIESTKATERRTHHGQDLFANAGVEPVPEKKGETMRIKFKVSNFGLSKVHGNC